MPRSMPDLVGRLQGSFAEARAFVQTIELLRSQQTGRKKAVTTNKARFAYELAYLRAFAAWEAFLEESFLRYLCGYTHAVGPQTLVAPAVFCSTIHDAELRVLGGRSYILWHNPAHVVTRSQTHFVSGRHEVVLNSVLNRVEAFAAVRHHIAHQKRDTANQFDAACITLCGHRLPGSRPGSFLRKTVPHVSPSKRWFELILTDLESYAAQITP
ncbi:conserved hypothetical protein [uncultured Defluviicoccus sp.]|uniref:Uncharacterized protein n=1 Tax=metagenome TaxID=256318 RepID=A0A380THW8_9ZZZZ|nr:conserved hypothetical protein [uncultured Defluviicoccus sp.]